MEIWARVGMSAQLTEEEAETIYKGSLLNENWIDFEYPQEHSKAVEILRNKYPNANGDSYVPAIYIEEMGSALGYTTLYHVGDIDF